MVGSFAACCALAPSGHPAATPPIAKSKSRRLIAPPTPQSGHGTSIKTEPSTILNMPPKADMCGATRYVRFVPIADIGLFSSSDKKRLRPGLFREHDEIGLESGLIAQGIIRDDKCGAYRQ